MIDAWLDLPTFVLFAVLILFYGITTRSLRGCARGRAQGAHHGAQWAGGSVLHRDQRAVRPAHRLSRQRRRRPQQARLAGRQHREHRGPRRLHPERRVRLRHAEYPRGPARLSPVRDQGRVAEPRQQGRFAEDGRSYTRLLREVSDPGIATAAGNPVHGALLNGVLRLGEARARASRSRRITTTELKWISVLILGVITQISLAGVHLDKTRAQLTAIVLFSCAAVVALGLIALRRSSRSTARSASPDALQTALTRMRS